MWVLEADIQSGFDEIEHTALMDRLRVRIKDKRICTLVKAFLKSGVMMNGSSALTLVAAYVSIHALRPASA